MTGAIAKIESLRGIHLIGIAVTDARHYLIPNEYTWGGLPIGLALSLRAGISGLIESAVGAAVGFALLYIVAVAGEKAFKKEAMGGGDIKMMAMVGAFLGWQGVLVTFALGTVAGAVSGLTLNLAGRLGMRGRLPFGLFRG